MPHGSGSRPPRKAVFLDRDGVVNVKLPEDHYVTDASEFVFLPGAFEALAMLKKLGFLLVLVTNQRGIARGMLTPDQLAAVHGFMQEELAGRGAALDSVYHCPHEVFENCGCRKPEPGMILAARDDLGIDLAASFMVGDAPSDVAAGKNAGTKTVRIGIENDDEADLTFPSLLDFAMFVQRRSGCFPREG